MKTKAVVTSRTDPMSVFLTDGTESGTESTSDLVTAVRADMGRATLEECLRLFPSVRFRVTGNCMAPVLPAGTTVTVAPSSQKPPRIGDLVLVRQPDGLRLHRLIWGPPLARGCDWRTKGDRSRLWDARIPQDAILGTVVASESGGDPRRGRAWRTAWSIASGLISRLRIGAAR
jgi:hypothetical protein